MQRRLTLALMATALAAVILAGGGVLLLAQFGARSTTAAEIDKELQLASELVAARDLGPGLGSLQRLADNLDLEQLEVIAVDDSGQAFQVTATSPGPRSGRRARLDPIDGLILSGAELERFMAGQTVVTDETGDDVTVVHGLRLIDTDPAVVGPDLTVALRAEKSVVTVGRRARILFAASAAAVTVLSAVVAWLLARRLTRPIRAIERVTSAIATGDFTARVPVDGHDELAELGRSVNRMAVDLERSKALDQQFLLSVSHDLRTPLTAITGYAEALRDGADGNPAHAGQVIATHAGRLERLVGDLLDLAKLDANRFRLTTRPIDAGVAVGRTVAGLVPRADRYGVNLAFAPLAGSIPIRADADRLGQAVANLVDNGLKFAASRVSVSVTATGTSAVVAVHDDGPGIPAADLPHIFDRLYVAALQPVRAENPSGLGLAIVRELTLAMGGTAAASSEPGHGTTMTLTFPLLDPLSKEREPDQLDDEAPVAPVDHGRR